MKCWRSVGKTTVIALLVMAAAFFSFSGSAFAAIVHNQTPLYEKNFDYGDNPIHYAYRLGYGFNSTDAPGTNVQSWMWIKNTNRSVGDGAIMSQAGLTLKDGTFGTELEVIYGPAVWNEGDNPAGEAVESHAYDRLDRPATNAYSWGNGFVRDPLSEYHHIGTSEYFAGGTL